MKTSCVRIFCAGFAFIVGNVAFAMESLDDTALSNQSGQDGLTIQVTLPNSTLTSSQVGLVDGNGISGSHLGNTFGSSAALVYAPATYGATQGVRFFNDPVVNSTPTLQPLVITMDAGSNVVGATLNVGVSLPSDLRRIRINPFSIYLSPAAGNIFTADRDFVSNPTGTTNANVAEILRVGAQGLDFVFSTDPVTMNFQFGNEPQGHMMMFTSGKILRIGNDYGTTPMQVMSKNGASVSSLKMDFDFCGRDTAVATTSSPCTNASLPATGFSLVGFYADINATGLVFGKAGTTDKFDLILGNAVAGLAGNQAATSFDNLKNGSMGSIGLVGVRVTDPTFKIRGM